MIENFKDWEKVYSEEKNRDYKKNTNHINFLASEYKYEGINKNDFN